MRMSARIPIAAAVGGGFFIGTYALFDSLVVSTEQNNQQVEACASQLGDTVITAANPPSECNKYFDTTIFNSKTVTVDQYNAASGNTNETVKTEYFLPSKKSFIKTNFISRADEKDQVFRKSLLLDSFGGFIALVGFTGTLSATKTRKPISNPTETL